MGNVRVEKDVKNHIQRRVNCEAANINKIVGASVRQTDAIRFLMEQGVFATLPEELIEMANLRMEYPDMGRILPEYLCAYTNSPNQQIRCQSPIEKNCPILRRT